MACGFHDSPGSYLLFDSAAGDVFAKLAALTARILPTASSNFDFCIFIHACSSDLRLVHCLDADLRGCYACALLNFGWRKLAENK